MFGFIVSDFLTVSVCSVLQGKERHILFKPGKDVCDQSAACDWLLPQYVLLVQCKRVFALLQAELLLYPSNHLVRGIGEVG